MQLVNIEILKCIRWYLKKQAKPERILVCADYEYQYILHHFKDWPSPMTRINTYEAGWEEALKDEKRQLTPNSIVIANEEILSTFRSMV